MIILYLRFFTNQRIEYFGFGRSDACKLADEIYSQACKKAQKLGDVSNKLQQAKGAWTTVKQDITAAGQKLHAAVLNYRNPGTELWPGHGVFRGARRRHRGSSPHTPGGLPANTGERQGGEKWTNAGIWPIKKG